MPAQTDFLPKGSKGFLAFPQQMKFLEEELAGRFGMEQTALKVAERHGDLIIFTPELLPQKLTTTKAENMPYWSKCSLLEPFRLEFNSIKEASTALKSIQRNWSGYSTTLFRRSALIQEKLPYINLKPRLFPPKIPSFPMGIYSLTTETSLIGSCKTTSLFPCGTLEFKEDHENPPSRAYLKFQEAVTNAKILFDVMPQKGNRCLDAGACPGGWTWALLQLGCKVVAIDRTELAASLMSNSNVNFICHDAFTLPPEELGHFEWVCSDVICYPERLLKWINRWIESNLCENMICTIKMQGQTNWSILTEFQSIPNSSIIHLNYNKHELTWLWHKN
ncbi:MAG: SAM-dependent methyltransferase [Spirochaetaceae bacterium]|nr:SAM-dependent methyltransferase [Spirochaetaceae bacterium]